MANIIGRGGRQSGPLLMVATAAAVAMWQLALAASAPPPAAAQPAAQPPAGMVYRHIDTWTDVPWTRRAGHFGAVVDVSSQPNNPASAIYVLDGRQKAVHVLAPDGTPRAVWDVPGAAQPEDPWIVQRLDVGFDGTLHILSTSLTPGTSGRAYRTRVDRLDPAGQPIGRIEVLAPAPYAFRDVAVRDDGRIYLSRVVPVSGVVRPGDPPPTPDPRAPLRAVDVLTPGGDLVASLSPPELSFPDSLDVAADGTLYVVNRVPASFAGPGPDPTATPRPSDGAEAAVAKMIQASGEPIEGILVFSPDHALRETVPFNDAEDIAVGRAGVFVARHVEIFALREIGPIFTGPIAFTGSLSSTILHLDVPADGRLLASLGHCYAQGVVVVDDPTTRPEVIGRIIGELDQPELEGPRYPLRIAASDEVAVLQGRYEVDRTQSPPVVRTRPFLRQLQTVQRWTRKGVAVEGGNGVGGPPGSAGGDGGRGRLTSQLGLCSGLDGWWGNDVAIDGTDVYTVDPDVIQRRPDDRLPAWTVAPAALIGDFDRPSHLTAVAADRGQIVALDAGAGEALVLDRAGALVARWRVAAAAADGTVAVDVALDARRGRVYVADAGRSRVVVRDLAGGDLGAWPVHDGPRGLAVGPSGDVFVLGQGGWGLRYRPDGVLAAAWPMPDAAPEALDVAVDADERVYVSYLRRTLVTNPTGAATGQPVHLVDAAGIWVFEAAPAPPSPPPPVADGCVARPDKTAAPRRIPLGAAVEIALAVDGRCPGRHGRTQIALVVDTSRSMSFTIAVSSALQRAREAVFGLLDGLAPGTADGVEVALITFDDVARLNLPLGRDLAAIRARLAGIEPSGDSRMAAGLAVARAELSGPRGDPAARRIVILVSDGAFKDDPGPAAAQIRAEGLDLHAWLFVNQEWEERHRFAFEAMVASPDRLQIGADALAARRMAAGLATYVAEPGLFETIAIEDILPANMRYVPGSAIPPATYDPGRHALAWALPRVAADAGVRLRFAVVPAEVGTWPTNVAATAAYTDARGRAGRLVFPVPEVDVFAPAGRIFLPLVQRQACLAPDRPLDVVLVMDTSSSMADPDAGGGRTKLAAAQAAAGALVDRLDRSDDHAAVVAFDHAARRAVGLTGDRAAVTAALAGLATASGTRIDLGLAEAGAALRAGGRPGAQAIAIVLTDGLQTTSGVTQADVVREAAALKAAGARLYAVGLGDAIDRGLLRAVASSPDRYYESPTTADLDDIYRQIAARLSCEVLPW